MVDFFLLNEDQVFGDKKLEIFKQIPVTGESTDYAKETGTYYYEKDNDELSDWWLKKDENKIFGSLVNSNNGEKLCVRCAMDGYGIRPAVRFSDIEPFVYYPHIDDANVFTIEFGSYPQHELSVEHQTLFETLYIMGDLKFYDNGVYESNGLKAVKAESNGKWFLYEPIKWIVDKNADIAVSKNILDGGSKNYDKVIEFLKNEFPNIALSEHNIIQFKKIARYNELIKQKAEIEAELKELDKEIMTLRRKK